jgi:hypothetical protein
MSALLICIFVFIAIALLAVLFFGLLAFITAAVGDFDDAHDDLLMNGYKDDING